MIPLMVIIFCLAVMPIRGRPLRRMVLLLVILLALYALSFAQTVPPPPVISTVTPTVGQVVIISDSGGCGGTTCGLTPDCRCWYQIYRAQCSQSGCPPPNTSSPYIFSNTATFTETPTATGMHVIWTDADPANLTAGTIWSYFISANYANYTPYTPTNPAPGWTNAVYIPADNNVNFPFSVYLDFKNPQCVNGNLCLATAYRALCPVDSKGVTTCPAYVKGAGVFTKLPANDASGKSYTTQTVSVSGTSFEYKDDGGIPGNLAYGTTYIY